MLSREKQSLQCRGVIHSKWLSDLLQLFCRFNVNIRTIQLIPVFAPNGQWDDEAELTLVFEQHVTPEKEGWASLFEQAIQNHLRLLISSVPKK